MLPTNGVSKPGGRLADAPLEGGDKSYFSHTSSQPEMNIKTKGFTMIDARDEVISAPSTTPRRRGTAIPATRSRKQNGSVKGLKVERVFSDPKVKPFDQIEWDKRTAEITDDSGKVIFKQENVEVPKSWSVLATKVVVSKYFYGEQNTPERETSVKQLINRVCRTIADWGIADGYFSKEAGEVFYEELTWLCVNQYGAFNSPVWFNVGLYHQYGVGKKFREGQLVLQPHHGRSGTRTHTVRISTGQRLLHPIGR
jgi:hypothetical protein